LDITKNDSIINLSLMVLSSTLQNKATNTKLIMWQETMFSFSWLAKRQWRLWFQFRTRHLSPCSVRAHTSVSPPKLQRRMSSFATTQKYNSD